MHNCAFIGIPSQLTLLRLDSCHVATVDVLEKVLCGMISYIKFSSMITIVILVIIIPAGGVIIKSLLMKIMHNHNRLLSAIPPHLFRLENIAPP